MNHALSYNPQASEQQILELLSDALASRGRKVSIEDSTSLGAVTYSNGQVNMLVPTGDSATARTTRIQQSLIASQVSLIEGSHRPHSQLAVNAVLRCAAQVIMWNCDKMPLQANRDAKAHALRNVRNCAGLGREGIDDKTFVQKLESALVGMTGDFIRLPTNEKHNCSELVADNIGTSLASELSTVRRFTSEAQIERAIRAYEMIIDCYLPSNVARRAEELRMEGLRKCLADKECEEDADEDGDMDSHMGQYKYEEPSNLRSKHPMKIIRLAMPEQSSGAPRTIIGRSGNRLNRPRISRIVSNKSSSGAFIKTLRLRGGTFLIDASGSMHIETDELNKLCRGFPAATVAYYSGNGSPDNFDTYGLLCIYAENGRRATEVRHQFSGNEVDLYALQWLLSKPAPRYFLTDEMFCGGPNDQARLAIKLLREAKRLGQVRMFQYKRQMMEAFAI